MVFRGTILAIDPGVRCGWAVLRGARRIDSGVWALSGEDLAFGWRFVTARERFRAAVVQDAPDVLVCERIAGNFMQQNVMVSLFGIVAEFDAIAALFNIARADVAVAKVKKFATGSGKATKAQMRAAARKRWKLKRVLNDEADALWIGETYRKTGT